jgi:hypothetical protein
LPIFIKDIVDIFCMKHFSALFFSHNRTPPLRGSTEVIFDAKFRIHPSEEGGRGTAYEGHLSFPVNKCNKRIHWYFNRIVRIKVQYSKKRSRGFLSFWQRVRLNPLIQGLKRFEKRFVFCIIRLWTSISHYAV